MSTSLLGPMANAHAKVVQSVFSPHYSNVYQMLLLGSIQTLYDKKKILMHYCRTLSMVCCFNFRMAQGTQCLHAIRNYMRKVKLKYQHVIVIITYYYSNLKSSHDNKSS